MRYQLANHLPQLNQPQQCDCTSHEICHILVVITCIHSSTSNEQCDCMSHEICHTLVVITYIHSSASNEQCDCISHEICHILVVITYIHFSASNEHGDQLFRDCQGLDAPIYKSQRCFSFLLNMRNDCACFSIYSKSDTSSIQPLCIVRKIKIPCRNSSSYPIPYLSGRGDRVV